MTFLWALGLTANLRPSGRASAGSASWTTTRSTRHQPTLSWRIFRHLLHIQNRNQTPELDPFGLDLTKLHQRPIIELELRSKYRWVLLTKSTELTKGGTVYHRSQYSIDNSKVIDCWIQTIDKISLNYVVKDRASRICQRYPVRSVGRWHTFIGISLLLGPFLSWDFSCLKLLLLSFISWYRS